MKVSEVIEELEVGETVWVKATVDRINNEGKYIRVMPNASSVYLDGHDEISLTEPQGEKVEVSQEFADWVEKSMMWKHDGSWAAKEIAGYGWGAFMHDPATEEELLPKKYPWVEAVQNNKEKHIKAIYDGYTVKPKRWVVRTSSAYFEQFSGDSNHPFNFDATHNICVALTFTDKSKAEAVAVLVEGSVEEVAE